MFRRQSRYDLVAFHRDWHRRLIPADMIVERTILIGQGVARALKIKSRHSEAVQSYIAARVSSRLRHTGRRVYGRLRANRCRVFISRRSFLTVTWNRVSRSRRTKSTFGKSNSRIRESVSWLCQISKLVSTGFQCTQEIDELDILWRQGTWSFIYNYVWFDISNANRTGNRSTGFQIVFKIPRFLSFVSVRIDSYVARLIISLINYPLEYSSNFPLRFVSISAKKHSSPNLFTFTSRWIVSNTNCNVGSFR